jgi:hypothetical protein
MKKTGTKYLPKNVRSPVKGKPIVMTQLSEDLRVFSVENFVSAEEMKDILNTNKNRMTPSEVSTLLRQ